MQNHSGISFRCLSVLGVILAVMPYVAIAQGGNQASSAQVVARSGSYAMTVQDMNDLLALNALVLQTPLSPAEQAEERQNILIQFQKNPSVMYTAEDKIRKLAEIARHGSLYERSELASYLWCSWSNSASAADPITTRWVAMIRRHNPPIVSADGFVVTKLQIDALFSSNDWVAKTAGFPLSTTESRNEFVREVQRMFASMPRQAKANLATADTRWASFQGFILGDTALKAKAVNLVHQNVHSPSDVAMEARTLENSGMQFLAATNEMSRRTQMLLGGLSGEATANNLSVFNHTMAPH